MGQENVPTETPAAQPFFCHRFPSGNSLTYWPLEIRKPDPEHRTPEQIAPLRCWQFEEESRPRMTRIIANVHKLKTQFRNGHKEAQEGTKSERLFELSSRASTAGAFLFHGAASMSYPDESYRITDACFETETQTTKGEGVRSNPVRPENC